MPVVRSLSATRVRAPVLVVISHWRSATGVSEKLITIRPSSGARGIDDGDVGAVGVAGGAEDEAGLGQAEPVAQEERERRLVERVAGRVAVRLGVEDPDPGAVGDHHGALGLVVLEADAAGLGEVEGAGLGRAVGVGLAEAALGAAEPAEVALDGADVDGGRRRARERQAARRARGEGCGGPWRAV